MLQKNLITDQARYAFQSMIWEYYATYRREFPWRYVENPYYIVVSEVMLQQTQTFRVEPKFSQFIEKFPSFGELAQASWPDVLIAWQGLGYNSRAKRLHATAKRIVHEFKGHVPESPDILVTFDGIGVSTAASICAFAFNKPTIFVETNIRAVFIHHFFPGHEKVSDAQIMPLVSATLDAKDPRSWYYALMDYGVFLKKQAKNPASRSKHYTRQSAFEGSDRQIRSMILRRVLATRKINVSELMASIDRDQERVMRILEQLLKEHLVVRDKNDILIV